MINNENKISKLMHIASTQVDYYKKERSQNISNYGMVYKDDIRNNYSKFLINSINEDTRNQILKILYDTNIKCQKSYNELGQIKNYIVEETTGTSGLPLRVVKSVEERTVLGLNLYRCRKKIDPLFDIGLFVALNHTTLQQKNPRPYDYSKEHIIKIYLEIIQNKTRWLHTSIVPLKRHMDILLEAGINKFPNLKYIELTGNFLEEEDINLVKNFFDVNVINMYGCMETWTVAYGMAGEKLDICEEVVKVEIVDEEGRTIDCEGVEGDIVITSLICCTMPFIRYHIGDRGKITLNNQKMQLELVEGRDNQYIKGIERKVLGTKQFGNILKITSQRTNTKDITYIQFIQIEINTIEIRINYFSEINTFLSILEKTIEERLSKKFKYNIIYVNMEYIMAKDNLKQELFICRC